MERKVSFILMSSPEGEGGQTSVQRLTLANPGQAGDKDFYRQREGLRAETAWLWGLTVFLKLVLSGLLSVIFIKQLFNPLLQGWFVSISLRPVLGPEEAYATALA